MSEANKQLLLALSSDLKRVSLCTVRGSTTATRVFLSEARAKADQLGDTLPDYLKRALQNLPNYPNLADQALVCSVLSKNLALS